MKCVKCEGTTKIVESSRVFYDKIVVNPVLVEKCQKCGEEFLEEKEFERVRQKVEKVKEKIGLAGLKKIQVMVV